MDLNYFAGFCDGDGCITMMKISRGGRHKSPEYKAIIMIVNTKIKILKAFKGKFGGAIHKWKKVKPHHKDRFFLNMCNQQAYNFCKLLKEKLFLKKRQAELIVEFYERRINNASPLSNEELDRRENLFQEMRKLNKMGENVPI